MPGLYLLAVAQEFYASYQQQTSRYERQQEQSGQGGKYNYPTQ